MEATKGVKAFCPSCGAELVAKMGDKKMHHWAHKGNRNCNHWWENETEWHRHWKSNFPIEWQEVVHFDETGEKHIADVKTDENIVLEFQHSYLKPEERLSRNQFYRNIIWVVDGLRRQNDWTKLIDVINKGVEFDTGLFNYIYTEYMEDSRILSDWINIGVPVLFDFGEDALFLLLPIDTNDFAYLVTLVKLDFIDRLLRNKIEKFLFTLYQDFNKYQYLNKFQDDQKLKKIELSNLGFVRAKLNNDNGNLTKDENKEIIDIRYNHLNLPTNVEFLSASITGKGITYVYDATGVKLAKHVQEEGLSSTQNTYYAGAYIYEQSTGMSPTNLKFISQPEGYIEPDNQGSFDYVYQFKDHLGNVRLSYSDLDNNGAIDPSSEILQERSYYPFGLQHRGYNNTIVGTENNHMTYNGQELNESLGLDIVEMTYRQYDPAIGRFNGMDRFTMLSPDITPYRFAFNNPIYWSDPSGLYEVDDDGNIKVTSEFEIEALMSYLNNNEGASVDDISEHIFTSGEFVYDLDEVVITVGSSGSRSAAVSNITSQVNRASSKISSFNGSIVADPITNANPNTSRGVDFASGAFTGVGRFSNPSSVVGVAMNAQVRGNNLSSRTINNLARTNQFARGTRALGRAAPAVSFGFALYDINNAIALDGNQFGYNSTITTFRSVGSIAGGWAGAEAGAAAGAAIGVWFGGVGAVPGAIIGGIIGGVICSHYGAKAGEAVGEQIAD